MCLFSSISLLLLLFSGVCSVEVQEGEDVEISCKHGDTTGQTVWWFQVTEKSEIKFIASFSGGSKKAGDLEHKFSDKKIRQDILTLKDFRKETDSGSYSCVYISKSVMKFGTVTHLRGTPDPVPEVKITPTARPAVHNLTTKPAVSCEHSDKVKGRVSSDSLGCELMILIPLASGCALLLILLIITVLYCNRIRTRRCPHHYKRQPRNRPAGHRPLPNQDF